MEGTRSILGTGLHAFLHNTQRSLLACIACIAQRLDSAAMQQVEEQRHQIETLEKENQVLKVILQEKNKV